MWHHNTNITKNDKKNPIDSLNYRPPMQPLNLLKIFELTMINILDQRIQLSPHQFDFKRSTSNADATSLLKWTIHYHFQITALYSLIVYKIFKGF